MTAGLEYEYLWVDPEEGIKKPIKCSAQKYIDYLMSWCEKKINDEAIFPSDANQPFPQNFVEDHIKQMFKRLFRVYAHMYYSHSEHIEKLGETAHVNTAFKHFALFCFEFDLISRKELLPMKDQIVRLIGERYAKKFEKKT